MEDVLHMNGGLGETSYANNSLMQRKVISMTKPIAEEAITELYNNIAPTSKIICIADLGCSSGPNTFMATKEIVRVIDKLRNKHSHPLPEFTIHLNDLPGTDFNSVFRVSLNDFRDELKNEIGLSLHCFVNGVPGSFYGRLFAAKTLHFVHSSYSLMWLSKVPDGMGTMNKDNIYLATTSPKEVIHAYYRQFQADFSMFLKCRSQELVNGGKMVLTMLGRKSNDAASKECCYIWELMAMALREMVSEGLIEEHKLHSFNIPNYTPSPKDVEIEVVKEGSFIINRLVTSEVEWSACGHDFDNSRNDKINYNAGYNLAGCMRSVSESLLVKHFGQSIIGPLFEKYKNILCDRMSKEDTKFVSVTVSMTKREI